MMKAQLKIIVTYAYEIDPKNYKEGISYEEMLGVDIMSAKEDPLSFVHDGNIEVTGTLIKTIEDAA